MAQQKKMKTPSKIIKQNKTKKVRRPQLASRAPDNLKIVEMEEEEEDSEEELVIVNKL